MKVEETPSTRRLLGHPAPELPVRSREPDTQSTFVSCPLLGLEAAIEHQAGRNAFSVPLLL